MSMLKVAACILPLAFAFTQPVCAQNTDEVTATVPEQWVAYADGHRDKRLYRRYTITQDATNIPNLVSFICPKDKSVLAHLTFHLASAIKMDAVVPSGFDKIEARFLVDGQSSFSLPGEIINSDMFFDRAPATWKEIDRIMSAKLVQMRFGPHPAKLAIKTNAEFGELIKKVITPRLKNPRFFSSAAVLTDCRKYRGE